MIVTGIKGHAEQVVGEEMTAASMGSGMAEVLATPAVVALMERACFESVQGALEAGQSTVGSYLNVTHSAPTPVGVRVWCDSVLTAVDGRRLRFEVTACDEKGEVAKGVHERFVVDAERFQAKAESRASRKGDNKKR